MVKGWKELWPRFFIFPIFQFSNIPLFPSSNIPVGPYDGGIVSDSRLNIEVVSDQRPRIGLLAGWGRYPVVIAEALRREGYAVYCLGIREHADREALEAICDDFEWVGIGRAGTAVRYFRRHGVTKATMAGKFHKKQLFQPRLWLRHAPDLTTIRHFYPYLASPRLLGGSKDRKDDTLLAAVVSLFGRHGIEFKPATDFAPELLAREGQLTRRGISTAQRRDIEFGWQLAKQMGRLDIGQSVIVKERAVLAVEAIEGTDECMRRAGELCPSGGFTVVKVAKPNQDMRFDVPTVGLGTVQTMVASGGRVLAIEARKTIIVDQEKVVKFANKNRLVITALDEPLAARKAA